MPPNEIAAQLHRRYSLVLLLTLSLYAIARTLEILPANLPRTAVVALDVTAALAFALVDGARHYRLRGILVFTAICIVVGNIVENVGVASGFPFGRYYFVELMGPKLFHVPVLLGLAYIGMSYVSWVVAGAILGARAPHARLLAQPLLAALVMTTWDLAQDPVWSTLLHGWVWRDGGAWFGVPVSNYLGWLGTVFIIFVLFALALRQLPASSSAGPRPAIAFYALCALGNVAQLLPAQSQNVVLDPTGHAWSTSGIVAASALVSVLGMGAFVALACFRLPARRAAL